METTLTFGNVEVVTDGTSNKILDIKKNGKPVKRGFVRGMKKAQDTKIWKLYMTEQVAHNPFSGVSMKLNGFEYSIFSWLIQWYAGYSRGIPCAPVQAYDDMKYLFLELNSEAYFALID